MSVNSSISPNPHDQASKVPTASPRRSKSMKWLIALALPLWVFGSFILSQVIIVNFLGILREIGVPFDLLNESVFRTGVAACVYLLSLAICLILPWLVKKKVTTLDDLGLSRLPRWMDIGLAPAAFIIYIIASGLFMFGVTQLFPNFNASEAQEVGFEDLIFRFEYILAFVTLVVVAPIAEETIFRGYLYGKLRKTLPLWVGIFITSLLFAALHVQVVDGSVSGLNVGLDVFILSIVLCGLRETTGSIWAGIMVHMLKNGLAFYLLFINTSLLSTMGG